MRNRSLRFVLVLLAVLLTMIILRRRKYMNCPELSAGKLHDSHDVSGVLKLCDSLKGGAIKVVEQDFYLENLHDKFPDVYGGRWRPPNCRAQQRVAILVTYRERKRNLGIFLNHMHPFLQRQKLDYTIFLIEQTKREMFNKGLLYNAGFIEITARGRYDCFILHDIDELPEDDRINYTCSDHPRHLSAVSSRWKYTRPYDSLIGGASAFTEEQFHRINGFSNAYFGWGGEDDDLFGRLMNQKYRVLRYPSQIARYKSVNHPRAERGQRRYHYLYGRKQRFLKDGINSAQYELKAFHPMKLYTHILVEVNRSLIMRHVDSLMTRPRTKTIDVNVTAITTVKLAAYSDTTLH